MANFETLRSLKSEGKLHNRLLNRIRILSVISLTLLVVALYQTWKGVLNGWVALGISLVAFLLGLFVFSRMNRVEWDEEKEVIALGRMDMFGFAILLLYIVFDFGLRKFLNIEFGKTAVATGYLLGAIGASLFGRSVGDLKAVHMFAKKFNV
jgi:hypothetical protein